MIYPFIYTRTKFHDFRVVTYNQVSKLPNDYIIQCRDIACMAINASTTQLSTPTWILVKNKDTILWGIACSNSVLSCQSDDKEARPVRGFFGLIIKESCNSLPFGLEFFKQLYEKYVSPIWDSSSSSKEISVPFDIPFGNDVIRASDSENSVNYNKSETKIFPWRNNFTSFVETVIDSKGYNSLAVNIHKRCQAISGNFSFMNVIMSQDSNQNTIEIVQLRIRNNESNHNIADSDNLSLSESNHFKEDQTQYCSICGQPRCGGKIICPKCENKQQNKKYIKYGLYGFMALICFLLLFNGSSIWEKILSPKHAQEKVHVEEDYYEGRNGRFMNQSSFLTTSKSEVNVPNANPDDVFKFGYESSSIITNVSSKDNWIRIITPSQQFSKKGIIEFTCEPLTRGLREGAICLTNGEGVKTTIPIYQSISTEDGNIDNSSHAVRAGGNVQNVIVIESDVETPGTAQNTETKPTFETSNH